MTAVRRLTHMIRTGSLAALASLAACADSWPTDTTPPATSAAPGDPTEVTADRATAMLVVSVRRDASSWVLETVSLPDPQRELGRERLVDASGLAYDRVTSLERGRLSIADGRWTQELTLIVRHDLETPWGGITHLVLRRETLQAAGHVTWIWPGDEMVLEADDPTQPSIRVSFAAEGALQLS